MASDSAPVQWVYLDHAAATRVLPDVIAMHADLCRTYYANPHATTCLSEACRRAIELAQRRVVGLLGLDLDDVDAVWTSGGTEADNLGCLGVLRRGGGACLVDASAHAAMLEACRQYGREGGVVREFPVTGEGQLDFAAVDGDVGAGVALVAVCQVNNETGVIQDLCKLRQWMRTRAPRALLMADAIQAFGRIEIPWREARIDMLAVSGRKIGGPGHVGLLLRRKGIPLVPALVGGGQQNGVRPGTMDTVGILAFCKAAELVHGRRVEEFARISALNRHLREQLCSQYGRQARIVSPTTASPYILSVSFPGYEGAVLMRLLAARGIVVGTGSACSAAAAGPSHVMTAMGLSKRDARGVLRISFGSSSAAADVHEFLAALAAVLAEY